MISLITLVTILTTLYVGGILFLRRDRLSKFPGPFLASFTDLYAVWYVIVGKDKEPFRDIHDKYGSVIRLGPNKLSFGTDTAAKAILSVSKNLQRSEWYLLHAATKDGHSWNNFFSTTDTMYHDSIRRRINRPFSLASASSRDPQVAQVVEMFVHELQNRFADKEGAEGVFDMSKWLQYFAWDVLSLLLLSEPFGYMAAGSDFLHLLKDSEMFLLYLQYIGQAPFLDKVFAKNPLLLWLNRRGIANYFPPGVKAVIDRKTTREDELKNHATPRDDILDILIQTKNKNPDVLTDEELSKVLLSVAFAGSDTTSNFVAGLMRYLLKYPQVYAKLQEEVDRVQEFSYTRPENAPYLDAVIKEVARIFPVIRFHIERMTPPEGMTIDGHSVPGGVKVGVNPWMVAHQPSIWGEDHDSFNPDRWLVDRETYKSMTSKLYIFGMGKYKCLGLHLAYAETYKVVPALLKAFEFKLANPEQDWSWGQGELVVVNNMNVRITSRKV